MTTTDPGQKIVVDGGTGDDTIDASAMTKDKTQPFLNGGPGKDFVVGSPGQDVISGGTSDDVLLLSGGLDTAKWAAGDGNDITEGGAGTDFLQIDGSTAADAIAVSPVGGRTVVSHNGERIDLGGLERIDILPAAGADSVRVDDMSGTATDHVDVLLTVARGSQLRDPSPDRVQINGTNGADHIDVATGGPTVRTTGLAAITTISFGAASSDQLFIDTKLGDDLISVSPNIGQQLVFSSL
jgi:hypothetical protein